MTPTTHSHPVNPSSIEQARQATLSQGEADDLAELLTLLAEPIRLRILFALLRVDELCVGDLALTLDISMDQSSYALKALRTQGLVQPRRDGRVMYYRLADDFPHELLEHCLQQLLTLSLQSA